MTTIVYQGESGVLTAQFYEYSGGPAADVTGLTITVKTADGLTTVLGPTGSVNHVATGLYTYTWAVSGSQATGTYIVIWNGTDAQLDAVQATELIQVDTLTPAATRSPDRDGMTYATVEDVKNGLDVLENARAEAQIRRVLRSATESVESLLYRRFYPEIRTQTLSWPQPLGAYDLPWTLWLDENEVLSVTSLVSDGTIAPADYHLKPDDGPPYTRIELDAESGTTFDTGDSGQNAVSLSGTFGFWNQETSAGTLASSPDDSTTTVDVSDGSLVGLGNLIKVSNERMVVTGRTWLDSTATLSADLDASADLATVSSGALLHEGEVLLVGSERMRVRDIAGNSVTVDRGWDGTSLASHTSGAAVYASRRLTVTRGALGTTAASHAATDPVTVHQVPSLVQDLTIAEAMAELLQERTGYARVIGQGEGESEVRGIGLADLRERAVKAYGRKKGRGRAA